MCKNRSKNEKGITILGLVITIIILLIIAGVSIAVLSGENGIINKYKDQAILSQLAIIEEAGNTIYLEGKAMGFDLRINDIVNQLQRDGYDMQVRLGSGITGIEILLPPEVRTDNKGIPVIPVEREVELSITPQNGEVPIYYFTKVQEKHYEIKLTDNGIEVNRAETDMGDFNNDYILEAEAGSSLTVSADTYRMKVKIVGNSEQAAVVVNITYGEVKADPPLTINVRSRLHYLNFLLDLEEFKDFSDDDRNRLREVEGYEFHAINYTPITGVSLDKSELTMKIGTTKKVNFKYTQGAQETIYYAEIGGVYHEIVKDETGKVQAVEGSKTWDEIQIAENTLSTTLKKNLVNITRTEIENGYELTVAAVTIGKGEALTAKYAGKEAGSTINVLSELEYLNYLLGIHGFDQSLLEEEGYNFHSETYTPIASIALEPSSLDINAKATGKVNFTYQPGISTTTYYAIIQGAYYEIIINGSNASASTTGKTLEQIFVSENTLEIKLGNNLIEKQGQTAITNGYEISLKAGSISGTSSITAIYAGKTATCQIKVKPTIESMKETGETAKEKTELKDPEDKPVPIPEGFKIPSDSGDKVDEGIVIEAPDKSQFVWVPVPDPSKMYGTNSSGKKLGKLYSFTATGYSPRNWTETNGVMSWTDSKKSREPVCLTNTSWSDGNHSKYNTIGITQELLDTEFTNMMDSVIKYKGFYVGRFETSLRTGTDGTKIAQSIKGVKSMVAGDRNDARYSKCEEWYGIYQKEKEYSTKNNLTDKVESIMIWGSQYDQMLIWMQSNNINVTSKNPITGAYASNSEYTGSSENDKLNNIYDLMGCRFEWTLEGYDTYIRIERGNDHNEKYASKYVLSYRTSARSNSSGLWDSSRITLYLK